MPWLKCSSRLLAGAAAGVMVLAAAVPAGAAQIPAWSPVSSPNIAGATNALRGVSCVSADDCLAVGNTDVAGDGLAESWDGSSWSVVPDQAAADASNLPSVACPTAQLCFAVGTNGTGDGVHTFIESWNGSAWSAEPGSSPGTLNSVSCASADACMAVGSAPAQQAGDNKPLAEFWNGTTWTVSNSITRGRSAYLVGVSCASVQHCVAVGGSSSSTAANASLTETWNGTKWAVVASPDPASGSNVLVGVSCPSATACLAIEGSSYAQSWDGTAWTAQPAAPRGTGPITLSGVTCLSATNCTVAGSWTGRAGPGKALVEHWNGTSFVVANSPGPAGTRDAELSGVTCVSATACTAVGSYDTRTTTTSTLVETGTSPG